MKSLNQLIIGASAVSGQAAIQALRESHPGSHIIGTTSGADAIPGVDETIKQIDVSDPEAPEKVARAIGARSIANFIYVPARGEVGLPAAKATGAMVRDAIGYSLRPMLEINRRIKAQKTICISGFITMEPLLECYGAMAFAKIAMEELVCRHPDRMRVIRFGMFHSGSVRGIALLVQRNLMRDVHPEFAALKSEWKESGKKFQEFFYEKNYRFEENTYRHKSSEPFRPTEKEDLVIGFKKALDSNNNDPIVNVLGDWIWTENDMPELPAVFQENRALMPTDLDDYFD